MIKLIEKQIRRKVIKWYQDNVYQVPVINPPYEVTLNVGTFIKEEPKPK